MISPNQNIFLQQPMQQIPDVSVLWVYKFIVFFLFHLTDYELSLCSNKVHFVAAKRQLWG